MSQVLDSAILAHFSPGFGGTSIPDWLKSWLDRGLGGITLFSSNCPSLEETATLISELRSYSSQLIVSIDEEGGDVTRLFVREGSPFPTPAMLGLCDDPSLTENTYFELGKVLRQLDIDMNLAPVADVAESKKNPIVGVRSFSSDFSKVSMHVESSINGLKRAGVAPCVKHFPGHGGVHADSHHDLAVLSGTLEELEQTHIAPFIQSIKGGTDALMVGHIILKAIDSRLPASQSKLVISEYLRKKLTFNGLVVTDALDMGALGGTKRLANSATKALLAGADILCFSGLFNQSEFISNSFQMIKAELEKDDLLAGSVIENAKKLSGWSPPKPQGSSASVPIPISPFTSGLEVKGEVKVVQRNITLIELSAEPTIAAGFVAWGLRRALTHAGKKVRLDSSDVDHSHGDNTQLIVAFRDAFRDKKLLHSLEQIYREYPDAIFVDMGWPTYVFQPKNIIRTFGSSALASDAAVSRML
ncbi:MAG: glycoside hydrolase family 3 N-terminal domain-containing protein [bacterium]